jgi:hypothetical protein
MLKTKALFLSYWLNCCEDIACCDIVAEKSHLLWGFCDFSLNKVCNGVVFLVKFLLLWFLGQSLCDFC